MPELIITAGYITSLPARALYTVSSSIIGTLYENEKKEIYEINNWLTHTSSSHTLTNVLFFIFLKCFYCSNDLLFPIKPKLTPVLISVTRSKYFARKNTVFWRGSGVPTTVNGLIRCTQMQRAHTLMDTHTVSKVRSIKGRRSCIVFFSVQCAVI